MARAFVCDRCGKIFTETPKSKNTINVDLEDCNKDLKIECLTSRYEGHSPFYFDLCQECLDDFCDWYNKPKIHEVEDKEGIRLTCKQLLVKEYPDNVGSIYPGGCVGCPHNYGYISEKDKLCEDKGMAFSLNDCEKCWSQVATKYYEKEKK